MWCKATNLWCQENRVLSPAQNYFFILSHNNNAKHGEQ
jgi:hypothetical protein